MCRSLFLLIVTIYILSAAPTEAQDFSAFEYRELGPYRGGRVTAVTGIASQPSVFYQGASGGGVWKTNDYGTTWKNVSDGFIKSPSIGSIAVAQNDPNIVYVGTGSDGLRSNVISGDGMYKSIDGGSTWSHIGLEKTGHIGAVRIHPTNHNIVYVAAIGQAFNANEERGIYKTTNGGKTWNKILYVSSQVGFSDIEFLTSNPDVLFASAWKAERKPWTIISGGTQEEGGIYKSDDAGQNWYKVTKGLPQNLIGKIDIDITPADSRVVYALVEAPEKEGGLYRSLDQGESFEQMSNDKRINNRPFYYTNVRVDPKNPDIVYVMAMNYVKSQDAGKTWISLRPPHGDNHDMWINPNNPDLFIQSNDGGANVTHNGGATWSTQFNQPTAEIYQVEVDDQYPYWVYGGQQDNSTTVAVPTQAPYGIQMPGIGYIMNTGGCETGPAVPKPGNHNIVYSNCKGRFGVYDKTTGMEQQYHVGSSNIYGHNPKDLKYRFQRVSPIHVSPHNPDVVYHCSQYVHKTMDDGKTWATISPDLTAFESDKQVVSGSPITRDITGEEFYSTIYAIKESTIKEGLIWVGANDGPIHVTADGGENWTNVTPKQLPSGGRVDGVEPSSHNAQKAYACILRYQLGDWKPYIFRTTDLGKSWTLLTNGRNGIASDNPVRVLREDPITEGILYAGTERGMFISLDDGQSWKEFQQNLPITPITDVKLYRGDLVLSSMGRGFWILENISSIAQKAFLDTTQVNLFSPLKTIRYQYPSGAYGSTMPKYPRPSAIIDYFLPKKSKLIKLDIINDQNEIVATLVNDTAKVDPQITVDMSTNQIEYIIDKSLKSEKGMHRFHWDMTGTGPWHKDQKRKYSNGPMVPPGMYTLQLTVDGQVVTEKLELIQDPRQEDHITLSDLQAQSQLLNEVSALLSQARKMEDDLDKEMKVLKAKKSDAADDKSRMDLVKKALADLKTEEGTYMQPMLVDQISYLYSLLSETDQLPGQDAIDRYHELKGQLEAIKI